MSHTGKEFCSQVAKLLPKIKTLSSLVSFFLAFQYFLGFHSLYLSCHAHLQTFIFFFFLKWLNVSKL